MLLSRNANFALQSRPAARPPRFRGAWITAPRVAQLVTLSVALTLSMALTGCKKDDAEKADQSAAAPKASQATVTTRPVTTVIPERREFVERLQTQATLRARADAVIGPKVAGVLSTIHVDEGDTVVAGETILFETESTHLVSGVKARKEAVRLARLGISEARARVAQASVSQEQATRELKRYKGLTEAAVVPKEQFEKVQTGSKQASAALKHAKVLVQVARAQSSQADVALEMAEEQLADAVIIAPISGTVVARTKEPGERANPGDKVITIADTSVVEVVAHLPAHAFGRVTVGQTTMTVTSYGETLGTFPLTHKAPTIDVQTRTFEVRAEINNDTGRVAPGGMVEIDVLVGKRSALAVPSRSILGSGESAKIFVVEAGKAKAVPVTAGIDSDGWTAVTGNVSTGAKVVTSGQNVIRDGMPVEEVSK